MLLTLLLDPHLEALGDLYVLVFLVTLVPVLLIGWRMLQARIDEDLDQDWDEEKQAAAEAGRVRRWLLLAAVVIFGAALWSALLK